MTIKEYDDIFKALADPTRRQLLDLLYERDGQTLGQLCDHIALSRFGVMKHLQILEEAGLLTTHKEGREKYHYLNPIPIQEVYQRWVTKYSQPWATALTHLKFTLEAETMTSKPVHKMQVYIRTTPQKLWEALTNGQLTVQYYMSSRVESTWEAGAPYRYISPDGSVLIAGEVLENQPPTRLVTTFNALWLPSEQRGETTRVTYEIELQGEVCKLTLLHEGLTPDSPMTLSIHTGWAQITSSLKSLLETGQSLSIPPM
jgi:DNA-binding transcriptional ArsR family regulator